jgi:hypothetical protein
MRDFRGRLLLSNLPSSLSSLSSLPSICERTLRFLGQAARSRRLRGTTISRSCAMVGKAAAAVPQALTAARKWIEDHA